MAGIRKYAPFLQNNEEMDENAVYYSIAQNINRIRLDKGISIRTLSLMANISELTLYRIESGITRASISVIYKIAFALNVKVDDILVDISGHSPETETGEQKENEEEKI